MLSLGNLTLSPPAWQLRSWPIRRTSARTSSYPTRDGFFTVAGAKEPVQVTLALGYFPEGRVRFHRLVGTTGQAATRFSHWLADVWALEELRGNVVEYAWGDVVWGLYIVKDVTVTPVAGLRNTNPDEDWTIAPTALHVTVTLVERNPRVGTPYP